MSIVKLRAKPETGVETAGCHLRDIGLQTQEPIEGHANAHAYGGGENSAIAAQKIAAERYVETGDPHVPLHFKDHAFDIVGPTVLLAVFDACKSKFLAVVRV